MSKRQEKIALVKAAQFDFLKGKKRQEIENKWEKAQLQAASAQSVLDYMIKVYEANQDKVTEEIKQKTSKEIELRKKEIEEFLMAAKNQYLQEIEEYNKSL